MNQFHDSVFFDNLVSKTVALVRIETFSSEEDVYLHESFWRKLCVSVYGKPDSRLSLNLQTWWIENTNSFKSKVLAIIEAPKKPFDEKEKNRFQMENENFNEILIKFDIHETIEANKLIATRSDGRRYFLATFTNLLNKKVENQGILCKFTCKFNWFKNEMGRKTNTAHWRGVYTCSDKNCNMIYTGTIESLFSNKIEIILRYSGLANHKKSIYISKSRCVGIEREKLAIKLVADGISNTRNEIINNSNFEKYNYFLLDVLKFNLLRVSRTN